MSLERIIRPFQTHDVSPPQRVTVAEDADASDVVLAIGVVGSAKTFNGSESGSITTYQDVKIKEKERETETKHITNPDDDSQFVDVELIKKLTTERGSGQTYQKSEYKLNNH